MEQPGESSNVVQSCDSAPSKYVFRGEPQLNIEDESFDVESPGKFGGTQFKTWQKKMLFLITAIGFAQWQVEDPPIEGVDKIVKTPWLVGEFSWKLGDYLCKSRILAYVEDSIYTLYNNCKTAKELWLALDKNYCTRDAGTSEFTMGMLLDFKIEDNGNVISQVVELQGLFVEMCMEGMPLTEKCQVTTLIKKLPLAWKNFANNLKQKALRVHKYIDPICKEENKRKSKPSMPPARKLGKLLGVNTKSKAIAKGIHWRILQWWKKETPKQEANLVEVKDELSIEDQQI